MSHHHHHQQQQQQHLSANLAVPTNDYVASNNEHQTLMVNDVVLQFGREYYTMLSKDPENLHCFYGKQSSLLHCQESEMDAPVSIGFEEIHQHIMSMGYRGVRVVISNIDCQPALNGSILVFVVGSMLWTSGVSRKFVQTFLLAEQPNGYYVLNDIMRILNDQPASSSSAATAVPEPVKKTEEVSKPVAPVVSESKPAASAVPKTEAAVVSEKAAVPVTPIKEKQQSKIETKTPVKQAEEVVAVAAALVEKTEAAAPAAPNSWAALAAVQQSKWKSGVVADSKGTVVASIAVVNTEKPAATSNTNTRNNNSSKQQQSRTMNSNGRVNYRTGGSSNSGTAEVSTAAVAAATGNNNGRRNSRNQSSSSNNRRGGNRNDSNPSYDPAKSIFVRNIRGPIVDAEVRAIWEACGPIKSIEIIPNKGFAFIEYEEAAHQQAALKLQPVYNSTTMNPDLRRPPQRRDDSQRNNSNNNSSQATR